MPDVMTALFRKRAQLTCQKDAVKLRAENELSGLDKQIKDIDKAIETLNAAVKDFLCPHCNGTGTVRNADSSGQMEDWPCQGCKGTGVVVEGDY